MNKYRNKVVYLDGKKFDSKKEFERYSYLKLLERAKLITEVKTQVPFIILDDYELNGKKHKGIKYIADFCYIDTQTGKYIVEDAKGFRTKEYKLKKKLFESKYRIEIKEV